MNLSSSNGLQRVTSLPAKTLKKQNRRKRFNRSRRRKNIKLVATRPASTIHVAIHPALPPESPEPPVVDSSWDIDSYRTRYDTVSLWNLKKWFMELHKETIPEHELVPLAQVFASMEAYGCTYAPELMERASQLGEPIARVYCELKQHKCARTLVSADTAVRAWLDGVTYADEQESIRQMQIAQIAPVFPAQTLAAIFQNIVVVNNSLKETTEWFERLGGGTISIAISPISYGVFEVKAYAANFFINKAAGTYQKAYAQCVADLLEILKNYCYQVNVSSGPIRTFASEYGLFTGHPLFFCSTYNGFPTCNTMSNGCRRKVSCHRRDNVCSRTTSATGCCKSSAGPGDRLGTSRPAS